MRTGRMPLSMRWELEAGRKLGSKHFANPAITPAFRIGGSVFWERVSGMVKGIACTVIGSLVVVLAVAAIFSGSEGESRLADAVYLDTPEVRAENEGKVVIVSGNLNMLSPAYDEEYAVTLQTPVATRYDSVYEEDSRSSGEETWGWKRTDSLKLYGVAAIGDFAIDDSLLYLFPTITNFNDFDDSETAGLYVYKTLGGFETYLSTSNVDISTNRRSRANGGGRFISQYQYFNMQENPTVTLVGKQVGSSLVRDEEAPSDSAIMMGIVSKDDIIGEHSSNSVGGIIFGIVIGAVIILFGLKGIADGASVSRK